MPDLQQLMRAERRGKRRFATPGLLAMCCDQRLQVLDLSLNGIGFASARSIPPKERLRLRICAELGHFTVSGRVVWCRFDGTFRNAQGEIEPHYRAGLRFDPLHPRDAQYLLDLLDWLADRERVSRARPPRLQPPTLPPRAG